MKYGVVFPQGEIEPTANAVTEFVEAVESSGFDHIVIFDHILGADTAQRDSWSGHYSLEDEFFEPLVLFGFLAAISSLELVTGVMVLPQRQTALVAKQAATIDILTGGRLRLGIGVGWNDVEYRALGIPFGSRGRRIEQQVELLRKLWTLSSVDATVDHEVVDRAGLAPLPIQRPIPIWFGSATVAGAVNDKALRRAGRLGDGFVAGPFLRPGPQLDRVWEALRRGAEEAGRSADHFEFEGMINPSLVGFRGVEAEVNLWSEGGASHLALFTLQRGLRGREHADYVRQVARELF